MPRLRRPKAVQGREGSSRRLGCRSSPTPYSDLPPAPIRKSRGEFLRLAKSLTEASTEAATAFLSYSTRDLPALLPVIQLLQHEGGRIYIDAGDPDLPTTVSVETARHLETRIESCPRLIVFASEATAKSQWVPWELGLAHGLKGRENVAIFPIGDEPGERWFRREYLRLYPFIEYLTEGDSEPEWVVFDPRDGEYWRLRRWLRGRPL